MTNKFESERLRAIIETVVDGIITIDEAGIIETVNPASENIFGYSAEEMIGHNVSMLMPEPYSSGHDQYITNFLSSREAKIIGVGRELVGRRKNGATFAMELAVNEMKVNEQRKFTGIVRDISSKKNIENNLRSSEAKIRAVLDTVLDSIITINHKGMIETVNPATEKLFGYSSNELLGHNINMLMPDPYHSEHDNYLRGYLNTGDKKVIGIGREVIGQRKNGTNFPMELAVSEMQIEGQRMFTGVVRDISERKRMEKLRQEFIATVSHELRTPLTSIRGSLGLLNSDAIMDDKETLRKLLNIAQSNTSKLLHLINDLLDFQKIEAGKMDYDFADVNIVDLVTSTVKECEHYGEKNNIRIVIRELTVTTSVIGDKFRLSQVLSNLISNAIKFSPADSEIEIGAIETNEDTQIFVRDSGKGISEEFREVIFSGFSQNDHSNTREYQGTGLGLSISKAIIDEHKGSIDFTSTLSQGSTFFVNLSKKFGRD